MDFVVVVVVVVVIAAALPAPMAARSKTQVCGRSSALRLWVRIPPEAWMFVCCECCVLSGRDLCDELITQPEKSYRLWSVVVCALETSWMRKSWPSGGGDCTNIIRISNNNSRSYFWKTTSAMKGKSRALLFTHFQRILSHNIFKLKKIYIRWSFFFCPVLISYLLLFVSSEIYFYSKDIAGVFGIYWVIYNLFFHVLQLYFPLWLMWTRKMKICASIFEKLMTVIGK